MSAVRTLRGSRSAPRSFATTAGWSSSAWHESPRRNDSAHGWRGPYGRPGRAPVGRRSPRIGGCQSAPRSSSGTRTGGFVADRRTARATLPAMSQGEAAVSIRHSSGGLSSLALLRQGVTDILSRRRLVRYLVNAEMKKRGSDTLLGNIWWVLDPLLQMVVYVIFVTIIGRGGVPDYPLFIFAAILPWKWFSAVISDATTSVVRHDRLIRGIAFLKLVLPVSTTTAGVVGFAWGMVPLAALLLYYNDRLSVMLVWIPVIA